MTCDPPSPPRLVLLLLPLAFTASLALPGRAQPGLTVSDLLVKAYRSIMDLDDERSAREIAGACGPAPEEACRLLRLVKERWHIELDLPDRSRDGPLLAGTEEAIRACEAWTRREPERAEAWFYLGAAYGVRAQMHGLRLERLAAARDGKRIKNALERALALDPGLEDAHYGIGVYKYLAGVVPAPVRFLAWLLLLPGGDRVKGMQEMLEARARGVLLADEADYQLHWFDLWYEHKPEQALGLLEGLRKRLPHNPVFAWRIAEVQAGYLGEHPAARDTYRALVADADAGRVAAPALAAVRGRLGLAEELDGLGDTDSALEILHAVTAAAPSAPYGALARAWYLTGVAEDRLGHRETAVKAYQAAIGAAPADDPDGVRRLARTRVSRTPDPRVAEAYRVSLEGWRDLERRAFADAGTALERAAALNPPDPVTRFRLGRLHVARGEPARALAEFERVIAAQPVPPPWILAAAYVDGAQLVERNGDRARAIEMYRAAAAMKGAERETRDAARVALARLGAERDAARSIALRVEH